MPQLAMLCFIVPVHHPILHHVIHAALYHSQSQYNTNYSHFTWSIHMMHHWHTLYHGYHITSYLTKSHLLYPHNTSHVPCTLATIIYCAMKYRTIPQYITPCLTMYQLHHTGTSSPIHYISWNTIWYHIKQQCLTYSSLTPLHGLEPIKHQTSPNLTTSYLLDSPG